MTLPGQRRRNVLCLGVSFACLEAQTEKVDKNGNNSADTSRTWREAVSAVERRVLTEMDGRDLARCLATEEACQVDVYTVSQEAGAMYRDDRHLYANFSRPNFCKLLSQKFPAVKFDQVVLDYFWIPPGWNASHWTRTFFDCTLPGLKRHRLLAPTAKVYLPFCLHCFQQVLACRSVLLQHYNVSFLSRDRLQEVSLWQGTQSIPPSVMQFVLGKRRDQENVYCTFGLREIAEQEQSSTIAKHHVMEFYRRLAIMPDIRFIVLEPLTQDTASSSSTRGEILGLSKLSPSTTTRKRSKFVAPRNLPDDPAVVTPDNGSSEAGAGESVSPDRAPPREPKPLSTARTKRRLAQSPTSVKDAQCFDDASATQSVKRRLF